MDIFEQAAAVAREKAPPPPDQPVAAALTAAGFGVALIGLYLVFQSLGVPVWLGWAGAAAIYGGYAYADCQIGWRRHRREYQDALAMLREQGVGPSVH